MNYIQVLKSSVAAAICLLSVAEGATVTWSSIVDTGFAGSNGIALTQGNYIRLGFFNLSDSAIQALASPTGANILTLDAGFKQFDTATIGEGTFVDGLFARNSAVSYSGVDASIPNSQMYIWAIRATDNSSLTAALGSVTEQAILYMPFGSNTQWRFPASDADPAKTIDIADVHAPGGKFLVGTYQSSNASLSGIFGSPAGAVLLQGITPIPEPSTFFAGAVLTMFAAGVRRRRRE